MRAGTGPLVEALAEVMLRAFGPLQIIAEEFGGAVTELDAAVAELALFGSWAARYRGEPGAEPADLDVLVVVTSGGLDRGPLYAAADRAQERPRFVGEALLAQEGLRPTQVGGHLAVSDAVRARFGGPLSGLGALRRRRNELEYPAFPGEHVEIGEVTSAITTAQNLFDAAHRLIGHLVLFT